MKRNHTPLFKKKEKPIKLQHKLENIYIQDKTLDKILCLEFNVQLKTFLKKEI